MHSLNVNRIELDEGTMRLVGENAPACTEPSAEELDEALSTEPEVGDLVQIEMDGAFQLEKPRRVRAIREDQGQKWVFIEGSETGIPMTQVIVEQKGTEALAVVPPRLPEEQPPLNGYEGREELA